MIECSLDLSAVIQLVELQSNVMIAATIAQEAVGDLAEGLLKRAIGRIYERQIPTSPTGRPLWKRSGQLRSMVGEPTFSGPDLIIPMTGQAVVPITNWPGGYAERRSKLGVTWFPRSPAGTRRRPNVGLVRLNDFLGDTESKLRTHAQSVFEERFRIELETR